MPPQCRDQTPTQARHHRSALSGGEQLMPETFNATRYLLDRQVDLGNGDRP
jgi:hypothetical protein